MMEFYEQLNWEKVRQFCIDRNLYTRGSNEEYSKMLQMCNGSSPIAIIAVSADILAHSSTDMSEVDIATALYSRCCDRWVDEWKKAGE